MMLVIMKLCEEKLQTQGIILLDLAQPEVKHNTIISCFQPDNYIVFVKKSNQSSSWFHMNTMIYVIKDGRDVDIVR